jgi:hypothetical protein
LHEKRLDCFHVYLVHWRGDEYLHGLIAVA